MAEEVVKLDFAIASVTANQVEFLIKNSGDVLSKQLKIDVKMPLTLVPRQIADAVNEARQENLNQQTTASKVSLANIATGPAGWSIWAAAENTGADAVIRLLNDLDQSGNTLAAPVKVEQNAQLKLRVPLLPQDKPAHVEITYIHRYPNVGRTGKDVSGKLQLTTAGAGAAPNVTFKVNHASPTTIDAGDPVNIDWEIEKGVSGTLYGPLPGGNSQMSLSSDPLATYKIAKGSLGIIAVGAATYTLHAEVRGENNINQLVVKSVQIDVSSVKQYSYLEVRPSKVLPHGLIEANWAVWDCLEARLQVGEDGIELQLTEQGPSQKYQGAGIWRVNAPQKQGDVSAWLEIRQKSGGRIRSQSTLFNVATWVPKNTGVFTGKPLGMAVSAPKLALLTTDGPWLAEVGNTDPSKDPVFKRFNVDAPPKAWRGIAAFEKGFVVLQQTNDDGLRLVRYSAEGNRDGLPVDLPADVQPLVRGFNLDCDIAVLGERIYIVVEAATAAGPWRHAFWVSFKPTARVTPEPRLLQFPRYRMIAFDNALYLISRDTGRMFRFRQKAGGELDEPVKAATAVQNGQSMIRQGLMVPVGRVLVVLSPNSSPSLDTLEGFGVLQYFFPKPQLQVEQSKQDLVYNPQQDHWIPCGHGLDIEEGAVAAFRSGASKRLWVVHPDGKIHTLGGAVEHLFAPEFEQDFSPKDLPRYLNKKRRISFDNQAGFNLGRINDEFVEAGVGDFTALGPAEVTRISRGEKLAPVAEYEFTYNDTDPVPMKLRFMVEHKEGPPHDYMLEITLSGPDLSITTVFKRLMVDAQGKVSVAEVPGTRQDHGAANSISIRPPRPLLDGINLHFNNLTSYRLILQYPRYDRDRFSPETEVSGHVNIAYNTPAFFIYVPGVGELHFDTDLAGRPDIVVSPRSSLLRPRIRIDAQKAGPLSIESVSTRDAANYECVIRYRMKQDLETVYIGDGGYTADGSRMYVPGALPSNASQAHVWKIDAHSLSATPSAGFPGKGVFSTPNGVTVLDQQVAAVFADNTVYVMDHDFQTKKQATLNDYTTITNLDGNNGESRMVFLGLKEDRTQGVKYHYGFATGHYDFRAERFFGSEDLSLDSLKGYRDQNRVTGAPAWVSSSTISPMHSYRGIDTFICIEGGLIYISKLVRYSVHEISLEGTGREEAVIYDTFLAGLIFCAHSTPDKQGLMISRIDPKNLQDKKTVTLPGPVVDMATDTRRFETPALRYKQHRAVSLATPGYDSLFVTHGRTIYHLNKNNLTVRESMTVDLPCRFLQVRFDKPSGGNHMHYGGPDTGWMVWAIGASYTGDGTKVDQYKTEIYKTFFKDRR